MKSKIIKYIQVALRLLFSILALFFVFRKLDTTSILNLISGSNKLVLAGSCMFFISSKIISSCRLNRFFHASGIEMSAVANLKLYWLGMFYNLFLPGGIGGDGYKVFYIRKNMNVPVKKSILALIIDRVTGLFALGILSMVIALFIFPSGWNSIYLLLAIFTGTFLLYFIVYRYFTNFYAILHYTNMQSFGVQLLQTISAWLILVAIGQDQQIISYLFVFLISSVVAAIPFTIGGVGARELTFLYASDILQLDPATSVSLSLLFFLITAIVSLSGSFYAIWPEKIDCLPCLLKQQQS